jgi:DNA (cytosine-5)-methyltransferase 1
MNFTIGSLFDGSGGFPLAATMCGGTPKWASEIEPYPIAVTRSRFPGVKHLGSVTDIKGGEVEPVDVITFGSPCQDLSVAGKRAGLKHEANGDDETTRSGLFMEAVRIIKEMREATNGIYPRFALWENVPGAFSSNNGEDFRIVLEELIKIAEPSAVMPEVPKNGWPYADSYCGDGWSLAYRVLDAQFWGVPQRRRRIYLVADFRGECAGKVSFERKGLRGYFETGRTPWQTAAGDAEAGSGAADCERKCIIYTRGYGGNVTEDGVSPTLEARAGTGGNNQPIVAYSFDALSSNSMKSSNPHSGCRQVEMAKCLDTTDPNPCKNQGGIAIVEQVPYTLKIRSGCEGGGKSALVQDNMSATLATNNDQYLFQPVMTVLDDQGGSQISVRDDGKCPTLRAEMHGNVPSVMEPMTYDARGNGDGKVTSTITGGHESSISDFTSIVLEPAYCLQGNGIDRSDTAGCNGKGVKEDVCYTLNTIDRPAVAFQTYQKVTGPLMANSHPGSYTGQDAFSDMLVAGVDARNATEYPEMTGALQADAAHNLNSNNVVRIQYIVRRLTPTECARLQGFPDTWGHPDVKTELTDEEYQFWLNVRNTHAIINDKATKEYTKEQILKWYNGLHTDSSEYKMWGNGIALPNALYMMQGIADVMSEEKAARRKWLNDLLGDCL